MIIECISRLLSPEQGAKLGASFPAERAELLEVGRRYVCLGLQYESASILWGTGAWVQIAVGADQLLVAPLALFTVVEPTPSTYWQVRLWKQGSLTLWPEAFYRNYFHADLEAGKAEARDAFQEMVRVQEREARDAEKRITFVGWGPEED